MTLEVSTGATDAYFKARHGGARKRIVSIDGLPEMPISGLRLTDVTGTAPAEAPL